MKNFNSATFIKAKQQDKDLAGEENHRFPNQRTTVQMNSVAAITLLKTHLVAY